MQEAFEKLEDPENQGMVLYRVALAESGLGDMSAASDAYASAAEQYLAGGNAPSAADMRRRQATLLRTLGRTPAAIDSYTMAVDLAAAAGVPANQALYTLELAATYAEAGQSDAVDSAYAQASVCTKT